MYVNYNILCCRRLSETETEKVSSSSPSISFTHCAECWRRKEALEYLHTFCFIYFLQQCWYEPLARNTLKIFVSILVSSFYFFDHIFRVSVDLEVWELLRKLWDKYIMGKNWSISRILRGFTMPPSSSKVVCEWILQFNLKDNIFYIFTVKIKNNFIINCLTTGIQAKYYRYYGMYLKQILKYQTIFYWLRYCIN